MTTVVLFHSVLGVRQGELDASARLRAAGHEVHLPDLWHGEVFDTYDPAMAFAREVGDAHYERALASVADLPDGFVVGGFSMGSGAAVHVALERRVAGVLQLSGLNPVEWFGHTAVWPNGVDSQSHQMLQDPFRDPVEVQARSDIEAAGGVLDLFDYSGTGHLFTDPTLPDEHDAAATELMWTRVLPFVEAHG